MVRGNIFSQSPEFILCDRRPLIRLTAPRLQLLQHSSARLSIPVVRLRAGPRVRLTFADRLVSGTVHAEHCGNKEKCCCASSFEGDLANCGCNFKMAETCLEEGKVRL